MNNNEETFECKDSEYYDNVKYDRWGDPIAPDVTELLEGGRIRCTYLEPRECYFKPKKLKVPEVPEVPAGCVLFVNYLAIFIVGFVLGLIA